MVLILFFFFRLFFRRRSIQLDRVPLRTLKRVSARARRILDSVNRKDERRRSRALREAAVSQQSFRDSFARARALIRTQIHTDRHTRIRDTRIRYTRRWKGESFSRSHYTAGRSVRFARLPTVHGINGAPAGGQTTRLFREIASGYQSRINGQRASKQSNGTAVPSLREK